jgi:hypothetical protein
MRRDGHAALLLDLPPRILRRLPADVIAGYSEQRGLALPHLHWCLQRGRAVGNPQTGRAQACGKFRARKRCVAELGPSAGRAAKRALRAQDKAKGAKKSRFR